MFQKKTNLTILEEMVCIWKKRTRWPLPSRGSQFNTAFFFYVFFFKKLDQSRGEGLYLKDSMTITLWRVPIWQIILFYYFIFWLFENKMD